MPRGDGTGPNRMGQMTGRGTGYCAGYTVPGYANPVSGERNGFGFNAGRGRGGSGNRNRFYATGLPGWQRTNSEYPLQNVPFYGAPYIQPQYEPTKSQEAELLKNQSRYLEDELSRIQKRLQEMDVEKAKM